MVFNGFPRTSEVSEAVIPPRLSAEKTQHCRDAASKPRAAAWEVSVSSVLAPSWALINLDGGDKGP